MHIKQFAVRMLLAILRGLVFVKQHAGSVLRPLFSPIVSVGRFLLRTVGVPVYRVFFWVKRHTSRVILPAKHRALYLFSNRYAVHVIIIALVTLVSAMNFGSHEVRAETYGKDSMLYQLVVQDDSGVVEVVAAGNTVQRKPSSYMNDTVVDANLHFDLNYIGEDYVTTRVGEGSVSAPTTRQGSDQKPQVPVRRDVQTYIVQNGDTLSTIAEQFGLNLSSLLWANDMSVRSVIRPGDDLSIPPTDGLLYTVQDGDTLNAIANKHNTDTDKILNFNKLAHADDLVVGEELMLPDAEKPSTTVARRTPSSSVQKIFTTPKKTTTPAPSSSASENTSRGSSVGRGQWVWPTNWRVITQYYGWRHTGVDIDGDYSTVSYAANDGVVIYSGWRSGYGLTVEVDHGNGYVTRYAHHSKNYVGVGDVVSGGQAIAQTGTTGRSTGTHLHFEVIKNGRFQNPLDYVR